MTYDPTRFRAYFEHEFSYDAGFRRNVSRFPNQSAIVDPPTGRTWTYAQLGADVERAALALASLGVGRGDRVAYQLFNCPEFAILYLATQRLAAIGVPINYRLAPGEIAHIIEDSEPRVLVYDQEIAGNVEHALTASGATPALLTVGSSGADAVLPGAVGFDAALRAASGELPALPADFSVYEETTRLYTSGTTGMPKGVALPSLVEVMSAHDVIMHFPLAPHDRTLNMTPWFHRGGLYSGGPNPAFYVGGSVVPPPCWIGWRSTS